MKGLGKNSFSSSSDDGLIAGPADIFRLARDEEKLGPCWASGDGYGETSLKNLVAGIEARRTISLERFIYALGVRHVGEQSPPRCVARHYGDLSSAFREAVGASTGTR